MTLFDLLFIAVFLTTVSCLVAAVFSRQRLRILKRLAGGLAAYFILIVATSLILPQTVIAEGSDLCFDDWCIAAGLVKATPDGDRVIYNVTLRLSSRARRVTQRELDLRVYVTGAAGERIEARPDRAGVPFDIPLGPGDSALASRTFDVPANLRDPHLAITHGGFPIGWFIIGYDTWFRKPAAVPLRPARS